MIDRHATKEKTQADSIPVCWGAHACLLSVSGIIIYPRPRLKSAQQDQITRGSNSARAALNKAIPEVHDSRSKFIQMRSGRVLHRGPKVQNTYHGRAPVATPAKEQETEPKHDEAIISSETNSGANVTWHHRHPSVQTHRTDHIFFFLLHFTSFSRSRTSRFGVKPHKKG